ncbi:MAG TPA: phosphoribosylformylglycinamidine synthase subunit PurS [Actinomycetota bacterium]|nr:phosphoribosylformylglycinamidine synthase subunit PurS [Actinomycetota bacterium]
MKFRFAVDVMPKKEISDPQGQTVERALPSLGYPGISQVRVGKRITLEVEADSEDAARDLLERASERVLSNPVIEEFEIEAAESSGAGR